MYLSLKFCLGPRWGIYIGLRVAICLGLRLDMRLALRLGICVGLRLEICLGLHLGICPGPRLGICACSRLEPVRSMFEMLEFAFWNVPGSTVSNMWVGLLLK